MYKTIKLTKGKEAKVDSSDFAYLSQFSWQFSGHYARRTDTGGKTVYMHREILGNPESETDHINNDGLDNRRSNLRLASRSENNRNRGLQKSNTSGYKGVVWHNQMKKWWARIQVDGKYLSLGLFKDKKEAADAYTAAALRYHREFANVR